MTLSTLEQAQARIAELELMVEAQQEQIAFMQAPKVSNRKRAAVLVIDGITLMDQPGKASQMKRLAAASKRNLERVVPLKLQAMKLGGKSWRFVEAQGVAPMIEVQDVVGATEDSTTALFDIFAGTGDWTDYYLVAAQ